MFPSHTAAVKTTHDFLSVLCVITRKRPQERLKNHRRTKRKSTFKQHMVSCIYRMCTVKTSIHLPHKQRVPPSSRLWSDKLLLLVVKTLQTFNRWIQSCFLGSDRTVTDTKFSPNNDGIGVSLHWIRFPGEPLVEGEKKRKNQKQTGKRLPRSSKHEQRWWSVNNVLLWCPLITATDDDFTSERAFLRKTSRGIWRSRLW